MRCDFVMKMFYTKFIFFDKSVVSTNSGNFNDKVIQSPFALIQCILSLSLTQSKPITNTDLDVAIFLIQNK